MKLYQRIDLADGCADRQSGPLPADLVGLDDATLADPSVHIDPPRPDYLGQGFFPVYPPATPPPPGVASKVDLFKRIGIKTGQDWWPPPVTTDRLGRAALRAEPLAYLAPDIADDILHGRQPRGLSIANLTAQPLPVSWDNQRALIARLGGRAA